MWILRESLLAGGLDSGGGQHECQKSGLRQGLDDSSGNGGIRRLMLGVIRK